MNVTREVSSAGSAHSAGDMDHKQPRHSLSPETTVNGDEMDAKLAGTSAGVTRMELFARAAKDGKNGRKLLFGVAFAVWICVWVQAMQYSTTYVYDVWATSDFQQHSTGIAALAIANGIIASVCLPFLAKFADVFSRPWVYFISLVCFTIGFIIMAASQTLSAYVVGSVLTNIGGAAISLLNTILSADLVPLQWRGMALGILSTPYLATVWFTADIAQSLGTDRNWRWGYGMYAIIMPVVMGPALLAVGFLENKAYRTGLIQDGQAVSSTGEKDIEGDRHNAEYVSGFTKFGNVIKNPVGAVKSFANQDWPSVGRKWSRMLSELDGVGLLLLGFGWSLVLLPFSLASTADNGYANRSLIAMFVVGGVCLVAYCVYEGKFAAFPSAPKRLLANRTVITAFIINFFYMSTYYIGQTYWSSYVYIVTDMSDRTWTYYNNILNMFLCSFGLVAGLVLRYTHRYKHLQLAGLAIKIIGYGLLVNKNGVRDYGRLVMSQVLSGIGGAFSVVGSQVASQAAVPHRDVALVISLLSLWTAIGGAIGSAISVAVWGSDMPVNLRRYIPLSVTDEEIATFFGDITAIKAFPMESEVRQGAITAYEQTVYPLLAASLGLSFISFIAGMFQKNFRLGTQQNAYDNKDPQGNVTAESQDVAEPKTKIQKILHKLDLDL